MKIRKWLAPLAVVATAALALTGCAGGSTTPNAVTEDGAPTAELSFAAMFQPTSWDPALGDPMASGMDFGIVYDTLVQQTAAGEYVPSLAESWEYNDDQSVLTIKIKGGQKFSDGTPEDADAVVANLEHYQDTPGALATNFLGVSDIEATDPTTVAVHFEAPNPSFAENLSRAFLAAPSTLGAEPAAPIGAGPYVYDAANSIPGDTLAYTANPDFHGKVNFAGVTHKVIGDPVAAFNALQSGQVDAALILALPVAQQAEDAGFARTLFSKTTVGISFFDREGALVPALADVKVRQAINYALDAKSILNAYMGGPAVGTLTRQVFGDASDSWDPSLDGAYPFDPAKAKQLLAEAGYADGFEVHMLGTSPWGDGIAKEIQKELGEVGITVVLDDADPAQVTVLALSGQYALSLQAFGYGPAWDTMQQQIPAAGAFNPLHVTDGVAEGLMHDYQYATTPDERSEIGKKLNKYVTDEAWYATFAYGSPSLFSDPKKITLPKTAAGLVSFNEWVPVD